MKKILVLFITMMFHHLVQSQNYNPAVWAPDISPTPLSTVQSGGSGILSFYVGNTGDDALALVAGQEMRLVITLTDGVPNNTDPLAAISGDYASYFDWQYDASLAAYLGVQNKAIPGADGGTIVIDYKVTSNSIQANPQNGFDILVNPPAYTAGINSINDDHINSYTWTEIKSDTITVTPSCRTCSVEVCTTGDDLVTKTGATTTSCGAPVGYSQEGPNAMGCYTYTPTTGAYADATTCQIICNGGLCDTTYVVIKKVESTLSLNFVKFETVESNCNNVVLNWSTSDEKNVERIEIFKSANGSSFVKIGETKAQNISNASYTFTDKNLVNGSYLYQVKAINIDESTTDSKIISHTVSCGNVNTINLYPNPTTTSTNILIESTGISNYEIMVLDQLGKLVYTKEVQVKIGKNKFVVPSNTFANGIYNVKISNGTELKMFRLEKISE